MSLTFVSANESVTFFKFIPSVSPRPTRCGRLVVFPRQNSLVNFNWKNDRRLHEQHNCQCSCKISAHATSALLKCCFSLEAPTYLCLCVLKEDLACQRIPLRRFWYFRHSFSSNHLRHTRFVHGKLPTKGKTNKIYVKVIRSNESSIDSNSQTLYSYYSWSRSDTSKNMKSVIRDFANVNNHFFFKFHRRFHFLNIFPLFFHKSFLKNKFFLKKKKIWQISNFWTFIIFFTFHQNFYCVIEFFLLFQILYIF